MIKIIKNLYKAFNIEDKKTFINIFISIIFSNLRIIKYWNFNTCIQINIRSRSIKSFLTSYFPFIVSYFEPENYAFFLLFSVFIIFVIKFL